MVKKNKSPWIIKQFSDLKQWTTKHKFWAVIVFIIALWILIWTAQAVVERYNYYRVERKLEALLSTMPNGEKSDRKIETERSCGRGSAKFSAGPLRCSVGKKATYHLSEFDNPKQIYPEIYNHINNLPYIEKGTIYTGLRLGSGNLTPEKVKNSMFNNLSYSIKLTNFKDFGCSLSQNLEDEKVTIHILCGRDARMEFFKIPNP